MATEHAFLSHRWAESQSTIGGLSAWFAAYEAYCRLFAGRIKEAVRYARLRQDGFTARDALGQVRTYNFRPDVRS